MIQSWITEPPETYKSFLNEEGDPYFVHKLAELSSHVKIGRYSYIHGNTRFTGDKLISVGHFCSIASGVRFQTADEHDYTHISTFPFKTVAGMQDLQYEEVRGDGISVGNDVWIGEGARILSGSVIGNGAVIGAGAVVRGRLAPYGIYYGNPAVLKRRRCTAQTIEFLERLQWWKWTLEKILANARFFSLTLRELENSGITEKQDLRELFSEVQA